MCSKCYILLIENMHGRILFYTKVPLHHAKSLTGLQVSAYVPALFTQQGPGSTLSELFPQNSLES